MHADMRKALRVDKPLALLLAALLLGGCMIFASAAFGLLARGATTISSVVFNHLILGVGAGLVVMVICAMIDYRWWRTLAPYVYAFSVLLTALVFVPHVGATLLGGRRWIVLGPVSLQPSEAMKIGSIMMAAAYFTAMRGKVGTWTWGLGGFIADWVSSYYFFAAPANSSCSGVLSSTAIAERTVTVGL